MFGKKRFPTDDWSLRSYAKSIPQEMRYDEYADYLDYVAATRDTSNFNATQARQIYKIGTYFLEGYFGDIVELMSSKLGLDSDWLYQILL